MRNRKRNIKIKKNPNLWQLNSLFHNSKHSHFVFNLFKLDFSLPSHGALYPILCTLNFSLCSALFNLYWLHQPFSVSLQIHSLSLHIFLQSVIIHYLYTTQPLHTRQFFFNLVQHSFNTHSFWIPCLLVLQHTLFKSLSSHCI